ncbi:hypothetical protein CerSpe_233340 [Prunus speciosa]
MENLASGLKGPELKQSNLALQWKGLLGHIDTRFQKLQDQFDSERNSLQTRFQELQDQFDLEQNSLQARYQELEDREKELEEKVFNFHSKMESKAQELHGIERLTEEKRKEVDVTEKRLVEVEKLVKEKETKCDLIQKRIEEGTEKLCWVRKSLEERSKELEIKEEEVTGAQGVLNAFREDIELNRRQLNAIRGSVEKEKNVLVLKQEGVKAAGKSLEECHKEIKLKKERLCLIQKVMVQCSNSLQSREKTIREMELKVKDYGLLKKSMEEWSCKLESKERELEGWVEKFELRNKQVESKFEELNLIHNRANEFLNEVEVQVNHFDSLRKLMQERQKHLDSEALEHSHGLEMKERQLEKQAKELELKQKQFDLMIQERQKELDSQEKLLLEQAKELELKQKQFDLMIQERQKDFDSQEKWLQEQAKELELKQKRFDLMIQERQRDLDSQEKLLQEQAKELELKQKQFDSMIQERQKHLESEEKLLQEQGKELELKQKQFDSMIQERQKHLESEEKLLQEQGKELELKQKQFDSTRKSMETNVPSSSSIQSSANRNGRGLQLLMNENLKRIDLVGREISGVLQASSDPAKLVLDAMQGFYPSNLNVDNQEFDYDLRIIRRSCLLLLQELKRFSPQIYPHVREEAMELAADWKTKIKVATENWLEILGFLRLVSTYEFTTAYDAKELQTLLAIVVKQDQATEFCQAFGITNKAPVGNIVSLPVKIEEPECLPVRSASTSSSPNLQLSATTDARNLQGSPNDHLSGKQLRHIEMFDALQMSLNPAKLVLKLVQASLTEHWKIGHVGSKEVVMKKNISILNDLTKVKPHVGLDVKKDAFVAAYGLLSTLNGDEIVKLLGMICQHAQALELCEELGFADKIPDFVQDLIERKQLFEAVRLICTFKLIDTFQPILLLKEYVEDARRSYRTAMLEGPFSLFLGVLVHKHIADFRAVVQCLKDNNLEYEFLAKEVETEIAMLETLKKSLGSSVKRSAETQPLQLRQSKRLRELNERL